MRKSDEATNQHHHSPPAPIPFLIAHRETWLALLLIWTVITGLSLRTNLADIARQTEGIAREGAREMFRMILLTRIWNAEQQGVYVTVTEHSQPNPYLTHPRRDLTASDGTRLTMINPAYMTRQISELARLNHGTQFHITSLKPIRPANAADEWEQSALRAFEQGLDERAELIPATAEEGKRLRYMAPLKVTQPCLDCHENQGYKLGDIRGGISVSLPFAPI